MYPEGVSPGAFGALGAGDPGAGGPIGLMPASSLFVFPVYLVPFLPNFLFSFEAELGFGKAGLGGPGAHGCVRGSPSRRRVVPTAAVQ